MMTTSSTSTITVEPSICTKCKKPYYFWHWEYDCFEETALKTPLNTTNQHKTPMPTPLEAEKMADEPKPEPYKPCVGDRVKLEGTVRSVGASYFSVLFDGSRETCFLYDDEYLHTTLLSRAPRTLTKAEAEALLTEKLGEQITIK